MVLGTEGTGGACGRVGPGVNGQNAPVKGIMALEIVTGDDLILTGTQSVFCKQGGGKVAVVVHLKGIDQGAGIHGIRVCGIGPVQKRCL